MPQLTQLTQAETLLAGLLAAVLVLLVWLLVRSYTGAGRLRTQLGDELAQLMEQQLNAQHRDLLRDLHEGLARQTDRIGEHARADRELLQRGLTGASLQLSRGMKVLVQSVDGRLDTLSGQVNQRLDEGFRKTNETFASVMARLATIDEAQKKIDGLTTNVVSLQELLGDKRARGAFGEVQLEALVQNMLPPDAYAFQAVLPNNTRVDCLLTLPAPTGKVAVDEAVYELVAFGKEMFVQTGGKTDIALGSVHSIWHESRELGLEKPEYAAIPTVEELAANPDQLKGLRQQCKTDRPKLGDMLCNRVAEATRKRFYGDGETPYTPPKESPKF